MSNEIELNDYLEYTEIYYKLAMKHKSIFGDDKHPHLHSLYTEGIIKKILGMEDFEENNTSSKKKPKSKCDSKLKIKNKIYKFEIKATGSKYGTTTINNSEADFILWGFFDCSKNKLDLELKLINRGKNKKKIESNHKKNSRSSITLNTLQNENTLKTFKIPLLKVKEENFSKTIQKVKTQFTNFLKKQTKTK